MDEATINAILAFFTACLPFAVAGIVWLEKKLRVKAEEKGISDKQGDLIYMAASALLAFAKDKFKDDPNKAKALGIAQDILEKMKATWEDPEGTTDMLQSYMSQLEGVLKGM